MGKVASQNRASLGFSPGIVSEMLNKKESTLRTIEMVFLSEMV